MANRTVSKNTSKTRKPKTELDNPLQKEILHRLSALDAVLSPFWSARSSYDPFKSGEA